MVVHKHTKLTPRQRKALAHDYFVLKARKIDLCRKYDVSYPTVNKILERARHGDFSIHRSVNRRYQCLEYGLKRLTKVSSRIEAKLKKQALSATRKAILVNCYTWTPSACHGSRARANTSTVSVSIVRGH